MLGAQFPENGSRAKIGPTLRLGLADKKGEQTQFYQVISVEGETLTYVAYTVLGDEYDRAVIVKDFSTGRKELR